MLTESASAGAVVMAVITESIQTGQMDIFEMAAPSSKKKKSGRRTDSAETDIKPQGCGAPHNSEPIARTVVHQYCFGCDQKIPRCPLCRFRVQARIGGERAS